MISVSGGRRGFYSNILWYLAHCHAAEKLNDEIEFVEFSPHYCDDIKTGFYQFYEHVEKNPIKYKDDFYYVNNIENIRYFNNTEICGFILDFEMRKYLKFLIDKYLIIKPHILEKIKSFGDKKVLGVHIRQTDLHTSDEDNKLDKPIDISVYIKEIEKNISDYDMLYLMSDNIESIKEIKKHFKKIEIYTNNVTISKNKKDKPVFRDITDDKYKLGEDIIIETEMLSKCSKIIITNSNISSFVLANNPTIKFQYLDLNINNELLEKYEELKKNGL